jgi:hypothetical protein
MAILRKGKTVRRQGVNLSGRSAMGEPVGDVSLHSDEPVDTLIRVSFLPASI